MLSLKALLDLLYQIIGVAANPREDLACLLVFTSENKKPRRLGYQHDTYQKRDSRPRFHPEHPAPGWRSKPKDRTSSASNPGKNVIAQKRAEQAHDNGHLL